MSVKWKIVLHVVVVLIIGIVIGALLNRALVQKRLRDMVVMRGAGLREPRPQKILRPADAAQEAKIQAVLDKHAQKLSEIHQRFNSEIDAAFKSLKEEIDPILTPEQKKAFEKMIPGRPPQFGRPPGLLGGPPRPPSGPLVAPGGQPAFPGQAPGSRGGPEGPPGQPPGSPGGMPGRPGGPLRGFPKEMTPFSAEFELAMLKAGLNLSEDQAAKIKAVLDHFIAKRQSLSEKGISPEDFDSFRQMEEKKDKEIEKILTAEQKEKYEKAKSRMSEKFRWPIPPA
jgi:hypothetical protein